MLHDHAILLANKFIHSEYSLTAFETKAVLFKFNPTSNNTIFDPAGLNPQLLPSLRSCKVVVDADHLEETLHSYKTVGMVLMYHEPLMMPVN